jgi:NadR type nicotinamide-nucleotide adenylyltransferase
MLKKIVIIGPESTGKSTLCETLAAHYQTVWCPEYARDYLLTNGMNYNFDDLLTIAKGQLALEEKYAKLLLNDGAQQPVTNYLFIDTDQYVMKVWCEYVFNQCHTWILNRIAERPCDLYLLCNVDLPWVKDELREYPNEAPRQELYHMYKDLLINQQVLWIDISGNYNMRFNKAVAAIDKHFFDGVEGSH